MSTGLLPLVNQSIDAFGSVSVDRAMFISVLLSKAPRNDKGAAFSDISWAEFKSRVYPRSVAQCMATLAPLDDKQFPALQAADLIAHTARRAFEKQLARGSIKYGDLYDMEEWHDELAYMAIYNAEYLRGLANVSWDEAVKGEWHGSLLDDLGS